MYFFLTGETVVRDVTAVQLTVTGPGRVKVIINWLPPDNTPRAITGNGSLNYPTSAELIM